MTTFYFFCYFLFFQDPRFNREVDEQTGYETHSLACMPVCNFDGEVIGVAQIINKKPEKNDDDDVGNGNKDEGDDTKKKSGKVFEFTGSDMKVMKNGIKIARPAANLKLKKIFLNLEFDGNKRHSSHFKIKKKCL